MFFKCFMCRKIKWGHYEEVQYSALNDDDITEVYSKKICPGCGDDIEKYGHLDDYIKEKDDFD